MHALLSSFRSAFDWKEAKAEGRVTPSSGVDAVYDHAAAQKRAAEDEIDGILREWQATLKDKKIELWSAAGSPTEPFQLAVPAEANRLSARRPSRECALLRARRDP